MMFNTTLYRGNADSVNRDLHIVYSYDYKDDGPFQTLRPLKNGKGLLIDPSFSINIYSGFNDDKLFIPANRYYAFISLLEKGVKNVSEHLYELFPNVNKSEFEIDTKMLEIFQTEKALAVAGMTLSPCKYINKTEECFPAIMITTLKCGKIVIPLEDAISVVELFKHFDPILYGASMLNFFGKFTPDQPQQPRHQQYQQQPQNTYQPTPDTSDIKI